MIALLILCVGVITVIVSCLQIWLYWPTMFDIYGRQNAHHYMLFNITTRHDLRKTLNAIRKDEYYRKQYAEIRVYKYLESKKQYKLIKTIKWSSQ